MRILLHDYGRYAFIVQLARALAQRGHHVLYLYSAADTARATITVSPEERDHFEARGIEHSQPLIKDDFVKRRSLEREHGKRLAVEVDRFHPDVVISANTPLDAQAVFSQRCLRRKVRMIYWVQDLLGIGIRKILKKKLPVAGDLIGLYYERLERSLLRQSDDLILISDDFLPIVRKWGIPDTKLHVIENWAPLDPAPHPGKDNTWAREHDLHEKFCVLYSGTMGMKHNPRLLLQLALRYAGDERFRVVVVSEGVGAAWLAKEAREKELKGLIVLPFQPFDRLPEVLATADILVALLEPSAGKYSVPSKVLTYLCAAKPLLLAVPMQNLAARIVQGSHAGLVVSPTDETAFVEAAGTMYADDALRAEMAHQGSAYAEAHFDIQAISRKFERVIQGHNEHSIETDSRQ